MHHRLAIVLLGVTACAPACHAQPNDMPTKPGPPATAPSGTPLLETRWRLTELNGQPAVPSDNATKDPHFVLAADGRVSGAGGVNNFFGGYERDGDKLTFKPGGQTMMAGPEPLMRQETAFHAALAATKSYHINGDVLTLTDGEKVLARFTAAAK
jgi:heat shock protein HslJ